MINFRTFSREMEVLLKKKNLVKFLTTGVIITLLLLTSHVEATTTTALSDTFTGGTINASNWSVVGGSGNTYQGSGVLTVYGQGGIGQHGVTSVGTFDRTSGDVTFDVDVTSSDCSKVNGYAIGYGDFNVVSGTDYYISGGAGGALSLTYFLNGNWQTESTSSFVCTNNTAFHLKLVILQVGGAEVYVNGSDTAAASVMQGSFTNAGIYMQHIDSLSYSTYDNVVVTVPVPPLSPTAPVASNVVISGSAAANQTLHGTYNYSDDNGDIETTSVFRWLSSSTLNGSYTAIPGATGRTYALTLSDLNNYIKFEVTPVNAVTPTTGTAVTSSAVGPIISSLFSPVSQIANGAVKNKLLQKGIYFGTYLGPYDISVVAPRPTDYLTKLSSYLNIYTVPAYWPITEPFQGSFVFNTPDAVTDFAIAHGAKIRIHPLVWHEALPDWLTQGTFTSSQLSVILQNHIQTIVTHYKNTYPAGTAIAIDVLNEAICDFPTGIDSVNCSADGLRKTIWSAIHKDGSTDDTDYIELAFQWAHEADPNAVLYYNEYGLELDQAKNTAAINLVQKLKNDGVPINGIGIQGHILSDETTSQSTIESRLSPFVELGMQIQITEFDASLEDRFSGNSHTPVPENDSNLNQQSDQYKKYVQTCINLHNCNAFVMWGVWDPLSWRDFQWLNSDGAYQGRFYPDILDDNFNQKPAFTGLATMLGYDVSTHPTVSAGNNQTITLPSSVTTLNGTVVTANAPVASYAWTQTSGPVTTTIASVSSATTSVSGLSAAGIYIFHLNITDDGGDTASTDTTVTVLPAVVSHHSSGSYVTTSTLITKPSNVDNTPAVVEKDKEQQSNIPVTPLSITRILNLTTPRMWGDDIKALQTFLNTKGYNSLTPDGNFGPKTQAAIIAFQKANGLVPDGSVGPNTLKYLNGNQTITTTSPVIQPAVTRILKLAVPRMIGDDVKTLQTYLSTNGYDVGTPDGILGTKTRTAVIAFQTANGLTPDGMVGARTLEMMK